jgi:hypothetical protein
MNNSIGDMTVESSSFGQDSREWLHGWGGKEDIRSCTLVCDNFIAGPWADGEFLPAGIHLAIDDDGNATWAGGGLEVATLVVDGTGGTFPLAVEGQPTAALAFNISAANLKAALEALPNVNPGDFTVTGGPGNAGGTTPYIITRTTPGNLPDVVAGTDSLTGGAGTAVITVTAGTGSTEAQGILWKGQNLKAGRKLAAAAAYSVSVRQHLLPPNSGLARCPTIKYLP